MSMKRSSLKVIVREVVWTWITFSLQLSHSNFRQFRQNLFTDTFLFGYLSPSVLSSSHVSFYLFYIILFASLSLSLVYLSVCPIFFQVSFYLYPYRSLLHPLVFTFALLYLSLSLSLSLSHSFFYGAQKTCTTLLSFLCTISKIMLLQSQVFPVFLNIFFQFSKYYF